MNKIGNVTFGKLDVRFLSEHISLLAAQDSVQILPVWSDGCSRAPSDCLSVVILDKSRQISREMCCAQGTELSWETEKESHFQGPLKEE